MYMQLRFSTFIAAFTSVDVIVVAILQQYNLGDQHLHLKAGWHINTDVLLALYAYFSKNEMFNSVSKQSGFNTDAHRSR